MNKQINTPIDYQKVLEEIYLELQPRFGEGKVADYIPALANVNSAQFAFSLITVNGERFDVGNTDTKFSIQSISKVFAFAQALEIFGADLYKSVGVEPSGNPFNSLVQLEYENGIPRNPFINAGAISVTDNLISKFGSSEEAFKKTLSFIKEVSSNGALGYNEQVFRSELTHGHRNLALANLMKSFSNLDNDPQDSVETYFKQCSIEMTTQELARSVLFLANNGTDPLTNAYHITPSRAKRINAVMLTCGHYDASGEFAYHVGLPGKSGVGGGIVALVPGKLGICVWSPGLNKFGNSMLGTIALELFTEKTGLSIF